MNGGKKLLICYSVDCEWSEWEEQSCTEECGGGTRIKNRIQKIKALNGGKECLGLSNVTEACNTHQCPSNKTTFHSND